MESRVIINTGGSSRRLGDLIDDLENNRLDPRPDFQRRLVWANKDKVNFIKTVLDGYPFPEIFIAKGEIDLETAKGVNLLVDGRQRLTTLLDYFKGSEEIRLAKDIPPYSTLPPERKKDFLNYQVAVRDIGAVPTEIIQDIFERINSTSFSLNAMEVNNARYNGALKVFAEQISEHEIFSEYSVFKPNDRRRMRDVEYCLSLIVTLMSGYFNRKEGLEENLERYNDDFPKEEEMRAGLFSTFSLIRDLNLSKESRLSNQADMFTAIVELHYATFVKNIELDLAILKNRIEKFYDNVNKIISGQMAPADDVMAADYAKYAHQASGDRSSRIARGKAFREDVVNNSIKNLS